MSKTLMAHVGDRLALYKLIEETGGELNPALETWLAEIQTGLAVKADQYKFAIDTLESESERLRKVAQDHAAAARSVDRIVDAIKDRVKMAMQAMGTDEVLGNLYRFKLSASAAKLVISDEKAIPPEFQIVKTVTEVDKDRVRAVLEFGQEVPGASLETGKTLRTYVNKGVKDV